MYKMRTHTAHALEALSSLISIQSFRNRTEPNQTKPLDGLCYNTINLIRLFSVFRTYIFFNEISVSRLFIPALEYRTWDDMI